MAVIRFRFLPATPLHGHEQTPIEKVRRVLNIDAPELRVAAYGGVLGPSVALKASEFE